MGEVVGVGLPWPVVMERPVSSRVWEVVEGILGGIDGDDVVLRLPGTLGCSGGHLAEKTCLSEMIHETEIELWTQREEDGELQRHKKMIE